MLSSFAPIGEPAETAQLEGDFGGAMHSPATLQKNGGAQPLTSSHVSRQRFVFVSHVNGAQSVLLFPSTPMIVCWPSQYAIGMHLAASQP